MAQTAVTGQCENIRKFCFSGFANSLLKYKKVSNIVSKFYLYSSIYISEHKQNAQNNGNRAQPLKRLLETLFLTIKSALASQKCAVSLANQLRAVADAFRP